MISTSGITLAFGQRVLFKDVSLKFLPGNTYGLIGANGAGKSTFLKILSKEIEADHGDIFVTPGQRVAVLKQNQFEFDEIEVLKTVIMGNKVLFDIMIEKEQLYAKEDFNEEDGLRASELEVRFEELNGWNAESEAGNLLSALDIPENLHNKKMKELEAGQKIKVLLAQALFGNPDILLLDEPTNNLDVNSIMWLEEFLSDFKNTVIVVSHDRHFLDQVCTHIADIDYGQISLYTGNYTFWYQASQLALQQRREQNKKSEDKIKELKSFIERFSANAAKSKQATARKKLISKLSVDEIKPSTRRYPHIVFHPEREAGKDLLDVKNLSGQDGEGQICFKDFSISLNKGEKVAFVGHDTAPATELFRILAGVSTPSEGEFRWGVTTSRAYFPKEHSEFFGDDYDMIEWLRQYAETDETREEEYLRGFLGKMLFTGEEVKKKVNVLSGGEKVRCLISKMMLSKSNVLILDEPTNHLDLESITALNNALIDFKGTLLFTSQDREFVNTVASRIVQLSPKGFVDEMTSYDDFLTSERIKEARSKL